jgi:hypothetical protein
LTVRPFLRLHTGAADSTRCYNTGDIRDLFYYQACHKCIDCINTSRGCFLSTQRQPSQHVLGQHCAVKAQWLFLWPHGHRQYTPDVIILHVQTVTPMNNTLRNTMGLFLAHVKTAPPRQSAIFGSVASDSVYSANTAPSGHSGCSVHTRRHCHTCTDRHTHQCYVVRTQTTLIVFCLRRVWIQHRLIVFELIENPHGINAIAHHQNYDAKSSYLPI